jgi:hypothetical protein
MVQKEKQSKTLQALRAAWVLARMVEDLAATEDIHGTRNPQTAMGWIAYRIVHWVAEAGRCGQSRAQLKCLAEAACANIGLRGLVHEHTARQRNTVRRPHLILGQSRRVGKLLWQMCEEAGRKAALGGWKAEELDAVLVSGHGLPAFEKVVDPWR